MRTLKMCNSKKKFLLATEIYQRKMFRILSVHLNRVKKNLQLYPLKLKPTPALPGFPSPPNILEDRNGLCHLLLCPPHKLLFLFQSSICLLLSSRKLPASLPTSLYFVLGQPLHFNSFAGPITEFSLLFLPNFIFDLFIMGSFLLAL